MSWEVLKFDHIYSFDIYTQIIALFFVVSFVIQLIYYLIFYRKIFINPKKLAIPAQEKPQKEPVSIIICAKDEAQNLKRFLPLVLKQKYPDYQVVVVNDCSEDNSQEILEEFEKKHDHLYITNIQKDPKFKHGKKLALTIGIKAAKNEWLLLTDADCYPQSENWLATMQENFTKNTDVVLGYGGYIKKPGFLNKIIRYDTAFIAMQYFSFALSGFPYMGVGRNLAYRKSVFFKNKGFASHRHLQSGDDDLFVNKVARKKNTRIELRENSFTFSEPVSNFAGWIKQKRRHFSTSKYYKASHKILLSGEILSRFLFYITFFLLLGLKFWMPIVTGIVLLRFIIQGFIWNKTTKQLKVRDLRVLWILFDILLPLLNFIASFTSIFIRKKPAWK